MSDDSVCAEPTDIAGSRLTPVDDTFVDDHFFFLLPFSYISQSADTVVVELANRADLHNSRGALQGGMVATLIDMTAGRLAAAVTGGHGVATSDLSIHFLTPVRPGPARATATLVRAGTRSIVVGVDVADMGRKGRLAARATVAFAVLAERLPGHPADGTGG
jgi:uncharacterized protein (TIGR00369 family)